MQEVQRILYIIIQQVMIMEEPNIYYQVERGKQPLANLVMEQQ